jgi:hypothetical protein
MAAGETLFSGGEKLHASIEAWPWAEKATSFATKKLRSNKKVAEAKARAKIEKKLQKLPACALKTDFIDFLIKMIKVKPEERSNAQELLGHKFVVGVFKGENADKGTHVVVRTAFTPEKSGWFKNEVPNATPLNVGSQGEVLEVHKSGAFIDFKQLKRKQWVAKKDYWKLKLPSPGPA